MTHDSLTTAVSYLHRDEAELARVQLVAAGIPAMVQADDEGGLNPGFYSDFRIRLVVAAAHLPDALEILGADAVVVDAAVVSTIVDQAVAQAPTEACGLISADNDGRLVTVHPATNAFGSPTRFGIDPVEIHAAMVAAEAEGETIAAVYHSHPTAQAVPSPVDVARTPGADWLTVIVGAGPAFEVRAYRIAAGQVDEVALFVE